MAVVLAAVALATVRVGMAEAAAAGRADLELVASSDVSETLVSLRGWFGDLR